MEMSSDSNDLPKTSTEVTETMEHDKPLLKKRNSASSSHVSSNKMETIQSEQTQFTVLPSCPTQSPPVKNGSASRCVNTGKNKRKSKHDLSLIDKDNILAEIEVRMKRLKDQEDYRNSETYDDLEYLKATTRYGKYRNKERLALIERLSQLGVVDLFKKLFSMYFGAEKIHRILRDILVVLWNGTDSCLNMCKAIIENNVHGQIIQNLESDILGPETTDVGKLYIIKGLLGIINNISRLMNDPETTFHNLSIVPVLNKYLGSKNSMIRCKCELILAYVMTEKEYEELNVEDSNLKFIIYLLEDAMSSPENMSSKYGFCAEEILQGINKIAVSDSNKLKLVEFGILKHYIALMQPECSTAENFQATRGIWILAFKCADDIKQVSGCLDSLKCLSKHSDDNIKQQALGALWILEGNEHQPLPSHDQKQTEKTPHVFISYQWTSQKTVLQIRDILRNNGYKVWMDVDGMTGSILESMAIAVEQAAVVVVCMSEKYKESPNCRTEAEYTFRLQKPIIPLRLQPSYKADGWLGALLGNKLYFDFSKGEKFDKSVDGLIKELGIYGKKQGTVIEKGIRAENYASVSQKVVSSAVNEANIKTWSQTEVLEWIKTKKLDLPLTWFNDVNGLLLMEMRQLHHDAPEFFFATLKTELELSLKQILRFTQALKCLK